MQDDTTLDANASGFPDTGGTTPHADATDEPAKVDGGESPGPCQPAEERTGEGTYYDFADGSGNCSFDPTPDDLLVGAMNETDYATSAVCGSCVEIEGPRGMVEVRIVDRCPECAPGDIDLSPEAFSHIANLADGRVPIRWRQIPCPVDGPIVYKFKDGSNQWWTAVQVRNHRHPVASFEWRGPGGDWLPVERLMYNYFVEPAGMGPGPLSFRVTDIHGHELVDTGVPQLVDAEYPGAAQFPPCAESSR